MTIVLFFEPDVTERARLTAVLERAGLRIEGVGDLREALVVLERCAPDLTIVVSERCGADDLSLVRRLREGAVTKDMPILALCGESSVSSRLSALSAGADDCLAHSVASEQLLPRVQNLLNRRDNLPSLAPHGFARRVLVVDDSPTYGHALLEELRQDGHDVVFAETAAEGLLFLERHRAELVILDVFLPDMNGIDVCRRIKGNEQTADLPVLILTGRERSAVRDAAAAALADDFVVKSRDFAAIRNKVRGLLVRSAPRAISSGRLVAVGAAATGVLQGQALFEHIVRQTGLSELLARSTVESVCRRLELEPQSLSSRDVPRVVDALARSLQLFLPAPEARERLAALNALAP